MDWYDAVEKTQEHVVKIATPRGTGSGFFIYKSPSTDLCAIATAAHVVRDAQRWEEPIHLLHRASGESLVLRLANRVIFIDEAMDTAVVAFEREAFPLPLEPLNMLQEEANLKVGNEIGWLGFPGGEELCFFSGRVSAWLESPRSYLVDGVAIHGVSGGPAFFVYEGDALLIGVVSMYIPNRATGEVLPGLSVVRDVQQVRAIATGLQTFEEAQRKKAEEPAADAGNEPPI